MGMLDRYGRAVADEWDLDGHGVALRGTTSEVRRQLPLDSCRSWYSFEAVPERVANQATDLGYQDQRGGLWSRTAR